MGIAFDAFTSGGAFNLQRGEELAHRHAMKVAAGMFEQMQIRADEAEEKGFSAKYIQSIRDFATGCGNSGKLNGMLTVISFPGLTASANAGVIGIKAKPSIRKIIIATGLFIALSPFIFLQMPDQ